MNYNLPVICAGISRSGLECALGVESTSSSSLCYKK